MPDVSALPQPGDVFAGKYLIERIIGSGRASLVFGARHCVTGKRFAIRWLLPPDGAEHEAEIDEDDSDDDDGEDVSDAERFLSPHYETDEDDDEAVDHSRSSVVGHFRHPNVFEVYDVGEQSGSLYTVMDWSEGESLDARLARTGPLPISEACRLLVPCMRGMHEAHAAGILHRDLKPASIFICQASHPSSEIVKVLDFEFDNPTTSSERVAALVARAGNATSDPYYRAPEQLGGLPTDHRVDVYAFGAILYQSLSGRPPFAPTRATHSFSEITSAHSLSLQSGARRLPPGADSIVARAMARNVEQRFQTLGDLADALEAYGKHAAGIVTVHSMHILAEIAQTQVMPAVRMPSASPPPVSQPPSANPTPFTTESVRDVPSSYAYPPSRRVAKSVYVAGALLVVVLGLGVRFLMTRDTDVVASYKTVPENLATDREVAVAKPAAASRVRDVAAPPSATPPSAAPSILEPEPNAPSNPEVVDPQLAAASAALDATLKMLQSQESEGAGLVIPPQVAGAQPPAAAAQGGEAQAIRLPLRPFPGNTSAKEQPSAAKPTAGNAIGASSNLAPTRPREPRVGRVAPMPARDAALDNPVRSAPKPRQAPVERDPLDMNLM